MGSVGRIAVGGRGQTARVWAVKFKFAPNKAFTFDIRYELEDDTEVSTVRDHDGLGTAYRLHFERSTLNVRELVG